MYVKKNLYIFAIAVLLILPNNSFAGSDGSKELSKKSGSTTNECFEGVSRTIFSFNQGLDKVLFLPLAKGYRTLPVPIRSGTSNFLSNISLLITIPNNLLQGELGQAGINIGRLAVNTTIGILGIFDPAEKMGLSYRGREDYGQTLGSWGMGSGCYFVLPVLGPTTVRDFGGTLASFVGGDPWYNVTIRNDTHYFKDSDYYLSRSTDALDFRAKNIESFDSLERNSVDFYAAVKSLYLQDRMGKIKNSKIITNTQDDSDWEEIETY